MPRLSGMSEATGPEKFNNSSKEIIRKRKISTTVCREQKKYSRTIGCGLTVRQTLRRNSNESSQEIVEFYELVARGKAELNQRLHKQSQGNKIFYEEYHVTEEDVIAGLCENEKIRELIYQK